MEIFILKDTQMFEIKLRIHKKRRKSLSLSKTDVLKFKNQNSYTSLIANHIDNQDFYLFVT